MSQSDLGALIGVSRISIYKWENDIAKPKMEKIKLLIEALKVTYEDLLD